MLVLMVKAVKDLEEPLEKSKNEENVALPNKQTSCKTNPVVEYGWYSLENWTSSEHTNDSASADTDPFQGIAIVLCDGARSSKNKEDKRDIRPDEQKMLSAVVAFLRGRNYRRNW